MKTLKDLYNNTPIQVVVDYHIQNDQRVQQDTRR